MGTVVSGDYEVDDTRHDHKACVVVTRVCGDAHPSDGDLTKIPKVPFGSVYLTMM
jgi:hypothetical protein